MQKKLNVRGIVDKIGTTDKFELAVYASIFQSDAFVNYCELRGQIFASESNITPDNLYNVAQLCYTYLKSCYITRDAAIASLQAKTSDIQEKLKPLIAEQNAINESIAGCLVQLKDADTTNEYGCYGFLPSDNEKYLEKDSKEALISVIGMAETITFERFCENGIEFAIIKGVDSNSNIVWKYETEKYECAMLDRVTEIGTYEERFYFIEDGSIIALKVSDGIMLWKNDDFEGGGTDSKFGIDGTLYVCGFLTTDFFAVDKNGNTIIKIQNFDEQYYWAFKIEIYDNHAEVTMDGSPNGKPAIFEVSLSDYTYKIKEENNGNALSNEELCELARKYYERVTSSPAPENVVVDSENGDMVEIWLYQDFGDHSATMDWYTVNRYTGEETKVSGEYINLLE